VHNQRLLALSSSASLLLVCYPFSRFVFSLPTLWENAWRVSPAVHKRPRRYLTHKCTSLTPPPANLSPPLFSGCSASAADAAAPSTATAGEGTGVGACCARGGFPAADAGREGRMRAPHAGAPPSEGRGAEGGAGTGASARDGRAGRRHADARRAAATAALETKSRQAEKGAGKRP